jgi:hypothetical protein
MKDKKIDKPLRIKVLDQFIGLGIVSLAAGFLFLVLYVANSFI